MSVLKSSSLMTSLKRKHISCTRFWASLLMYVVSFLLAHTASFRYQGLSRQWVSDQGQLDDKSDSWGKLLQVREGVSCLHQPLTDEQLRDIMEMRLADITVKYKVWELIELVRMHAHVC